MYAQGNWQCPYCKHNNTDRWDVSDFGAVLRTCNVNEGGCGGIVVVNVARVEVLTRTRRVEGEGAAEEPIAPPAQHRAPQPMEALPMEALPIEEQPVEEQPVEEHAIEEQPVMDGAAFTASIKYKWVGYYHEVRKMEEGRRFSELPKSARLGMIATCGQEIAAHLLHPPSMAGCAVFSPAWMPGASGIMNAYFRGKGWREESQRWHLTAKGLAS